MRTKFLLAVLCGLLGVLFSSVSAAQSVPQSVCLITDVGILNDGGFNQSAYDGMQRAVEEFGLDDTFIETQAPSDYEENIQTCLDSDFDVIITVGFALADATYEAALINTDNFFIGVDQDFLSADPLPNLVGLQFREDQGGFLAGTMAALMTESDIVGGVYGPAIFPVVKFRNGFEQGVAYTNADVTVLGNYSESFETPTEGAEVALTMIGDGADVIFGAGGRHGTGAIRRAAEEGTWVIGVDLDQYFTDFGGGEAPGADRIVTSVVKGVDNGVYDMIVAAIEDGVYPANSTYVLEIANGGIGFTPSHDADVPDAVIEQVQATLDGLGDGSIVTGVDPVTGDLLDPIPVVAAAAGDFSTLLAAADAAGLVDTLTDDGPFMVLAPTDAAFNAALDALGMTAEEILADTDLLTDILTYHVYDMALTETLILNVGGGEIEMLNGDTLTIALTEDGVMLNDSVMVTATDVHAANGVIHVIDGVLLPPTE